MIENKKHIYYFDTARALCMLWIVGFWHLSGIVENFPKIRSPYHNCLIVPVLSTFTFISGFFLSRPITNKVDLCLFYKKRFFRFFPLYFLSCLSMYFACIISGNNVIMTGRQFLLSLVGVSCFWGPPPITLWYFSMLIFLYWITPLIKFISMIYYKILFCVCVFLLAFYCINKFHGDKRLFIYLPVYFVALFFGENKSFFYKIISGEKSKLFFVSLISALCCFFNCVLVNDVLIVINLIAYAVTSFVLVIYFSKIITQQKLYDVLFSKISYASMCAYLFHTQFYWVWLLILKRINVLEMYIIILPLLLIISFVLQRYYDKIVSYYL